MRGASAGDIARLEDAAKTPLSDSHREFLTIIGSTPVQALNPFLNDCDYCIDTLVAAYAIHEEAKEPLPSGIVYFSSSDIAGSNIFLRHGKTPASEPEIGDIRFETEEFICKRIGRFESWLRWSAFEFQIGQKAHEFDLKPPWDETTRRWLGEPDRCWNLLEQMGFRLIFSLDNGTRCGDNGKVAAMIYSDGSGSLASDEIQHLWRLRDALKKHLTITIKPEPQGNRLHSPRE